MEFLLIIVLILIVGVLLFLKFHPVFGGKVPKQQVGGYGDFENYSKGKFLNEIETEMDTSFKGTVSILKDFMKNSPDRAPSKPLVTVGLDWKSGNGVKFAWFGHSALLLEIEGKTLLLDPMFGRAPSPVPIFGGKRYSGDLPFEIEKLPQIDAVLLSHDHYDHLDYGSIKKLAGKVRRFIVPHAVGNHLMRWGVERERISEHNWWDEVSFAGLRFVCTPARHFSGRGLTGRNSTLWCSWVLLGEQAKIYFSGDSGYGPHFKKIGDLFGPFDITFMECGQYDERWAAIHMMPEETVQAHVDVKGGLLIPIHWGAFTLALHDWTDPVERVTTAAKEHGVAISTPRIGEIVALESGIYPTATWWR